MKSLILCVSAALLAAGCDQEGCPQTDRSDSTDIKIVTTTADIAVKNAIITQHTIYPYHFYTGTSELNELGLRDINVLAGFYRDHPGELNVRKADADQRLYDARVKTVLAMLSHGGVSTARVQARTGLPGGDGMSSERAVKVLDRENQKSAVPSAPSVTGTIDMGNVTP